MNKYSQSSQYAKYINHGKSINTNINKSSDVQNPLTSCIFPNIIDNQFLHGSTGANYISHCKECQNYMADRCSGMYKESETWDKYCKMYVKANTDTVRANQAAIDQRTAVLYPSTRTPRTIGEKLLRNSLERRFLIHQNTSFEMVQFDPNISNSPYYRMPKCATSGAIVRHIDKATIDNNPLMNAALENYTACIDVLSLIWAKWKMGKLDLSGTKMEASFKTNNNQYQEIYNQIVAINIEEQNKNDTKPNIKFNIKDVLYPVYKKGIPKTSRHDSKYASNKSIDNLQNSFQQKRDSALKSLKNLTNKNNA